MVCVVLRKAYLLFTFAKYQLLYLRIMQHKDAPSTVVYIHLIPISIPGTDVIGGTWLCCEVKSLPLAHQSLCFLFGFQLQVL